MVFPCQPPFQLVGKSFQISIFGKYVPYVPRLEPQTLLGAPSDRESCLIPSCLCVLCSGVCVSDSFVTPWTVAHQASLSTGFSRQEYWSGLPCLSPEDLPHPRMEPKCLVSQADSLSLFFFSSTTLLLPTHLPPPSGTHAQSCNPMDCSPPGSSIHGLFQARILEWVAISSHRQILYHWAIWEAPCLFHPNILQSFAELSFSRDQSTLASRGKSYYAETK